MPISTGALAALKPAKVNWVNGVGLEKFSTPAWDEGPVNAKVFPAALVKSRRPGRKRAKSKRTESTGVLRVIVKESGVARFPSNKHIPLGRFALLPMKSPFPAGLDVKLARKDGSPMFGALFSNGVVCPEEKIGDSNV